MAFSKRSRRQEEETVTITILFTQTPSCVTAPKLPAKLKQKETVLYCCIVALPCEICGELCPSDRLMKHQEECSQESENTVDPTASGREENLYGSNLPHFRFSSALRNSPNSESLEDSFDDFTFHGSPYYILANVFRDFGERRWPFEMMRNVWSHN